MVKYYLILSHGKKVEVDHDTYIASYSDPYLTQVRVIDGETITDKITKETEHDTFKALGNYQSPNRKHPNLQGYSRRGPIC